MLNTGDYLTIGVIVVGFFGQTMYFKGAFGARLDNIEDDVDKLKDHVRYTDTCDAKHRDEDNKIEAVSTRVKRLEDVRNGIKTTG